MKLISFATTTRHYQRWHESLLHDCETIGQSYYTELLRHWTNDKREACLYRPAWIRRVLDELQEPVLWVDVDSTLLQRIEIDLYADVGFVNNPEYWRRKNSANYITAGVIWFNNTKGARNFLHVWQTLCEAWKPGDVGSHRRLCWARESASYEGADISHEVAGKIVLRGAQGSEEVAL